MFVADNLQNRGPQDDARVNVNQTWEVAYWTKKFGVTEMQLRAAVNAVGVMAADVKRHLGK